MDRLTILGLEDRFFSKSGRPLLFEYQQRISQKKSVQMLRAEAKKIGPLLLLSGVKSVAPYVGSVAVLVLAIGAGIWYLKNKWNMKRNMFFFVDTELRIKSVEDVGSMREFLNNTTVEMYLATSSLCFQVCNDSIYTPNLFFAIVALEILGI